jgi:hypothetical protein
MKTPRPDIALPKIEVFMRVFRCYAEKRPGLTWKPGASFRT